MKTLNLKEISIANGGVPIYTTISSEDREEMDEAERRRKWQKWIKQEKRKMTGIADIRMRAAEDALKAAVRLNRAEMDIKAAQRAATSLN